MITAQEVQEETLKLLDRMSRPTSDWISLSDAYLYSCLRFNDSTAARLALRECLQKSDLKAQAAVWKVDQSPETNFFSMPAAFWVGGSIAIRWNSNHAVRPPTQDSAGVEAKGIRLLRDGLLRVWPLASSVAGIVSASHRPRVKMKEKDVKTYLLGLGENLTEPELLKAAKRQFPDQSIYDGDAWRTLLKDVPHRSVGENDRTLTARSSK